ncbi:hypothetical protein Ahy_A03g017027 isoform B [Arachis hypogaea]|uniref:Uncharacterized protein n=1 Tax=Arachis hypogaea TaxID=3818 RepID=A0A445E525_ARAHY|nr:hypothetical protein Ahy_A03g017027 isoform B [Arachis hypogaea]
MKTTTQSRSDIPPALLFIVPQSLSLFSVSLKVWDFDLPLTLFNSRVFLRMISSSITSNRPSNLEFQFLRNCSCYSLMLGSGSNLNGSTSSGITSSDMPPLPQYLPLDPITLGSKKYTRSGELRRVLGVSVGNTSEDHSFGTLHHKPMAPVAPGELKNFKESVQDASRKARDRSKMLGESLSKLDRYREAIALNTKKRQRTDLSSERGSGVNLTKMGSQTHKTPNDNLTPRSEVKTSNSMLNKRLRTAVADVREESRSAAIGRQQMVTEKDGNSIQTLGGGSVRNEEKTRRLLAGGEGLDQKIKKKRSVGAVGNRVMTGERDVKRSALPKANADSKMRFYDTQGFRLKPLPGSSGINKSGGSSEPSTIGVRNMLASEPEGGSLHRDHIAEQKVVAKGSNRFFAHLDIAMF